MPTTRIEALAGGVHLAQWRILESEQELLRQRPGLADAEWQAIAQPERRREWLASRLLLADLAGSRGIEFQGVVKDVANKPYLQGASHAISLSHTQGLAVAAISEAQRVGIDVERRSPRVANIARRFLHQEEWEAAGGDWQELLVYWCAKEALYKLHGQKGVIFREELRVDRKPGDLEFQGYITAHGASVRASLALLRQPEHIIVCAVEQ
jgi:phosphopantetheinyl transferase